MPRPPVLVAFVVAALVIFAIASVILADTFTQRMTAGDILSVECTGDSLQFQIISSTEVKLSCLPPSQTEPAPTSTATPTNEPQPPGEPELPATPTPTTTSVPPYPAPPGPEEPTATPTEVPGTEPTATPTEIPGTEPTATPTEVPATEPTATPTNTPEPPSEPPAQGSQFPGIPFDSRQIPIELQAWWMPAFGHIHATALLPLGQRVSGDLNFNVRIVLHDNPSHLEQLRIDDDSSVRMRIPLNLSCGTGQTCAFNVPVSFDTTQLNDGWREIRIRAETQTPDGKKFLNSAGIPLLVDNGGGRSDYNRWCNNTSLIGRGWYDGFDYTNAVIECVPLEPVSGVQTFGVRAQHASAHLNVALDKTHHVPAVGPWPEQPHSDGTIIFDQDGDFGSFFNVTVDTTQLADGWHSLAVTSTGPNGAVSSCSGCPSEQSFPSGVAKMWFFVNNGNPGSPEPPSQPTATATASPTPSDPTATPEPGSPTATNTPVPPTATTGAEPPSEPTNTPTPVPPTATATATSESPTATATSESATATATSVPPTATATSAPPSEPPSGSQGIWISPDELAALPMSGSAWDNLLSDAQQSTNSPDISNQDDDTDVYVLAKALVYARTGQNSYRDEVVSAIMAAIGTEQGGRTLALGRNLVAYVIAADLVNLSANSAEDQQFRSWLQSVRSDTLDGRTLISTHEDRPNNWGTHAGASRAAVDVYLGDTSDLQRTADVFKGWLGDRGSYSGFSYGDLSWQCDSSNPVGINPQGCSRDGHSIDGVLPDDQRRAGGFTWPPPQENYVWEGLQGAVVQAEILYRAGYDTWNWENQAMRRAVEWLHSQANYPAGGDDSWQPWIINFRYGTNFPASSPTSNGKNMSYTDWTHAP